MLGILGTQCCTQAALAAALAVAPCMLCSFTEPGRATFEKTEITQMYVTHTSILPCRYPLACKICSYASAQSRSSTATKIAKRSGDNI